ncbi:Uncharacterised protein [Mycobacterium tuberculosis]|uniref:Uncharacterized protein n=1 Tax=Mycobacterium tuberculosis TaxID=1773 RepID=A0A0T9AV99_MYCTX|nr:Uncharacterised protein [Mycobacterium tuberculosis]CKQ90607.1 Uncharacterised protein [Mycobacterium tuberculosis]CKR37527.1 Uncharacterised protein [Mycobacterium tuberculosis]CKR54997.1 Uncharacterised protein [Mycobacterium tuberculosis]CKR60983.1 Uncharacterised protein [Mycobacterium tuberculosis]
MSESAHRRNQVVDAVVGNVAIVHCDCEAFVFHYCSGDFAECVGQLRCRLGQSVDSCSGGGVLVMAAVWRH